MGDIELGRRIKLSREACGKTLLDVATEVGVNKSTVQRYEQGKIDRPKLPVIESIAGACGVNPLWLIGKSNDMYCLQPSPYKTDPQLTSILTQLSDRSDLRALLSVYEGATEEEIAYAIALIKAKRGLM
ncbi:MAG: XRE family transcriptional regulator [Clostridia bacterium]|nr:XRE family transcriptional regulator [Clostridia bacterium]